MTSLGICYQAYLFSSNLCGRTIKIFLCHFFFPKQQQDYELEAHKFWLKPYYGQSIWASRNFLRNKESFVDAESKFTFVLNGTLPFLLF